ncbi:MAG TPA: zinc ribbon domain-containing protein [Methylomirabilota bacterium]|nr:zinc ribbon domain-containing protein [Methylomirabilota bacterium]
MCPSCQAPSGPGATFCHECGARLDRICPGCGAPVDPEQKFCARCGARLPAAGAAPAPAAERFEAPSGYTPPHLAELISALRMQPLAERCRQELVQLA